MKEKVKVVVIGGGASGMMAAGRAAENNAEVILIEKNNSLGKKILITGNGRCNLTNMCDQEEFIANFPGNGRFLYGPIYTFSNFDLFNFFTELGVELKVEADNKVFPVSNKAFDVVKALEKYLYNRKVKIIKGRRVIDLIINKNEVKGVILDTKEKISADRVIICTGGLSYPSTGSSGDGYKLAEKFGHKIVPLRPSLVPLETVEKWVKDLQGLSLKDVKIELKTQDGKKLADGKGDLLFTHFGVSGPVVLSISRKAVDYWREKKEVLYLIIDIKPELTLQELEDEIFKIMTENKNKQLKNILDKLIPKRFIPIILKNSGIDSEKINHQIKKEERKRITDTLKKFPVQIKKTRPLKEAIVTAGGVDVREVNPQSMESKIIKNLYFAGEVLDIDGFTGGFNLQAAFSTGFIAGESASLIK